jgi:SAM-dependent methyltransferase
MSKLGLYIGETSFESGDENYFINIKFDALNKFYELNNEIADMVIVDKCLQKLDDFNFLFENIYRILKPGGTFIAVVPDFSLYEKCLWPSRFNPAHRHSFSSKMGRKVIPRETHWNTEEDLMPRLEALGFKAMESFIDDSGYDYDKPLMTDQTKEGASCYLFFKVSK